MLLDVGGSLDIEQQVATGTANVRLIAHGDIGQSPTGIILANQLGVRQEGPSGNVLLDDENAVNIFAAANLAPTGMVTYHDVDDLTVGTVAGVTKGLRTFTATSGIQTNNGDVLLDVGGSLDIEQQVATGTANVRLIAHGDIGQSPTGIILANQLGVRQEGPSGNVLLDDENAVNIFAAANLAPTGMVTYHDVDDLTVGTVAGVTKGLRTFTATSGIQTNNGDVLLDVGNRVTNLNGGLVIAGPIVTGPGPAATTGDVRLIVRGDLSQTAPITADLLGIRQQNATLGNVLLDGPNAVNELAATNLWLTGMITYHDVDDLTVGSVPGVTKGLSTFNQTDGAIAIKGDVKINAVTSLAINRNAVPTPDIHGNLINLTSQTIYLGRFVDPATATLVGPTIIAVDNDDSATVIFNGPVMLRGSSTVIADGLLDPPVPLGGIIFASTLNSRPKAFDLDLTAGKGDILFKDTVGSTGVAGETRPTGLELGSLTIVSAHDVFATKTLDAKSLTQIAGTGLTTLQGNVTTSINAKTWKSIDIRTDKILVMSPVAGTSVELKAITGDIAHSGTVTLEAAGKFVLTGTEVRPVNLKNVVIITDKGKISSQVLDAASDGTGAFGALDLSKLDPSVLPIQGHQGVGQILVNITDSQGMNFTVSVNWREVSVNDTNRPQEYARVSDITPSVGPAVISHTYTATPPDFEPGHDITIWAGITEFAGGTINLKTNNQSILIDPNGTRVIGSSPNGIQVVLVVKVSTPTVLAVPPVEPLPVPAAIPPAPVAHLETTSVVLVQPQSFAEAASAVASTEENRFYELRIVTIDAAGNQTETESNAIDLTHAVDPLHSDRTDSIYPFNPGKLRELFRRLPDAHYRIYLFERGVEHLMLDFTIQEGRPVNIQDNLESTAPPSSDSIPASEVTPSVAPVTAPNSAARNEPESDLSSSSENRSQSQSEPIATFAQRIGRTTLIAQGGVLLAIAGRSSSQNQSAADRRMARFGRRLRKPSTRKTSQLPSVPR